MPCLHTSWGNMQVDKITQHFGGPGDLISSSHEFVANTLLAESSLDLKKIAQFCVTLINT